MKQEDFIKRHEPNWKTFKTCLLAIDNNEDKAKGDLPKLYRQISHDLATARARQYSPALINQLNSLLLSGQAYLYKTPTRIIAPLIRFIQHDFKQSVHSIMPYVIWAHILFYGFALISALLVVLLPESVRHFVDSATISSIEVMYDPSSDHFSKERASDSDFLMFAYYIRNNISIAFQCFAGGLVFGLGSLFYLIYNAIFFGAISGHIINIDYGSTFFSFVVTHGSFELSAIVLSAAAGGVMGKHLIAPGRLSRADSLKLAGKRTFPVILVCFFLLVLAAFVEAFWSSSRMIPNEVKYIVGGLCWLWVLMLIFKRGAHGAR